MPNYHLNSDSRLRPCLNCGEQTNRAFNYCWKCGSKRGAVKSNSNIEHVKSESKKVNSSSGSNDSKSFITRVSEIVFGIVIAPISISFFLASSILALLLLLMLSVLPAIIHLVFVEYAESHLKSLSRSPRSVFILATLLYWSVFVLIGFILGKLEMKHFFLQAVQSDGVTKICEWRGKDFEIGSDYKGKARVLTFIPFLSDLQDDKDSSGHTKYFYKKRCLLILPSQKPNLRALIVSSLVALTLISVVSFLTVRFMSWNYWWLLLVCDMLFIMFSSILGFQIGKLMFKLRLMRIKKRGFAVINNCVLYGSWRNEYIFICPFEYMHKFSLEEAEQAYKYQFADLETSQ